MTTNADNGYLDGRVIVITGGGSGFGKLVGEMAAARGARVVLADLDGAEAAAAGITDADGSAIGVRADVRELAAMHALVARAVAEFGAIDVMINNAGTMPLAFYADHASAYEAWDRCIDVNLKGVLNGICAAYDPMIAQGRGHVVNISSIYGNAGTAGSAVYSATKAAVVVLSEALRKESQGRIKVTVVRPTGVMGTGLAGTVVNPAGLRGIVGANEAQFMERAMASLDGSIDPALTDIDSPAYWTIAPEVIATEVLHAVDQPWGVVLGDITIRATGEDYLL